MPSFGNPYAPKLDLHGYGIENGYQNIVVTVNGRRLSNIDMVAPLLGSISPQSIERIEIIKGSGIVTAGDGANAGVVNIVTKKSGGGSVGFYGGLYDTYDADFYAAHDDDTLTIVAHGEAHHSGALRRLTSTEDEEESSKLATGGIDFAYRPFDALEFRLGYLGSRSDVNYAGSLTKEQYDDNVYQSGNGYTQASYHTDATSAGLSYDISDTLRFNLDASREEKLTDSTNVSSYGPYNWVSDYLYDRFDANLEYLGDALEFTAGIDGFDGTRDNRATAYAGANSTTKNNLAAYALAKYGFDRDSIRLGVRAERVDYGYEDAVSDLSDDHNLYGVEAAYNHKLGANDSVQFSYAHGYQSPDIDRFFATVYPPPDYKPQVGFNGFIDPMKSDSFTLGYTRITTTNKLKLSAYYIRLQDEIYLYSDSENFIFNNTNIDKSHKFGFDLYDRWVVNENLSATLNYNFVQAIIDEEKESAKDYSGNTLPGVSEHNVKLTLTYLPNSHTSLSFVQLYRSDAYAMNDFGNDFAQKQDAYMSSDITVSYTQKKWEAFARISNLFNQKNGLWVQDDAIYPTNYTSTAVAGVTLKF